MPSAYAQLYVHLVWATWDRLPLITEDMEPRLFGAFRGKCEDLGCHCLAIGAAEDHVHLLVRYPASVSIATLVGQLKGGSSHLASHELGSDGPFRWQGSYGALSVSKRSLDAATAYVLNQKLHHAQGSSNPALERCQE